MSQRQVLSIVDAMLKDDTYGLAAKIDALALALPGAPLGQPGPLSSQLTFYKGKLPGIRPTNGGGNVMIRPARWVTNTRIADTLREGSAPIEVGYETFSASDNDNVDQATLVATALVQCFDSLVEYGYVHRKDFGDCIKNVAEGIDFSFGDFEGPTSYGFICRATIQEVSSDD